MSLIFSLPLLRLPGPSKIDRSNVADRGHLDDLRDALDGGHAPIVEAIQPNPHRPDSSIPEALTQTDAGDLSGHVSSLGRVDVAVQPGRVVFQEFARLGVVQPESGVVGAAPDGDDGQIRVGDAVVELLEGVGVGE